MAQFWLPRVCHEPLLWEPLIYIVIFLIRFFRNSFAKFCYFPNNLMDKNLIVLKNTLKAKEIHLSLSLTVQVLYIKTILKAKKVGHNFPGGHFFYIFINYYTLLQRTVRKAKAAMKSTGYKLEYSSRKRLGFRRLNNTSQDYHNCRSGH